MASDYIHPSQLWSLLTPNPQALRSRSEILRLHLRQNESTWVMNSSAIKADISPQTKKTLPMKFWNPFLSSLNPLPEHIMVFVFSIASYICQAIPSALKALSSLPVVNSDLPSRSQFQCNHLFDAFANFPGRKFFPLLFPGLCTFICPFSYACLISFIQRVYNLMPCVCQTLRKPLFLKYCNVCLWKLSNKTGGLLKSEN